MAKRKRTPPAKSSFSFPVWLWFVSIAAAILLGLYLWPDFFSEPVASRPTVTAMPPEAEDQTSLATTTASASVVPRTMTPAITSAAVNDEPTVAATTQVTTATPTPTSTSTPQDPSLSRHTSLASPTIPPGTMAETIHSPSSTVEHSVSQPVNPTVTLPITGSVPPPIFSYNILNVYPHDRDAYTQGLIFLDGIFYEGTGLRRRSTLRKVEVESGRILQQIALPPQLFGEGVTIFGDSLFQLTWKARQGFEYDKDTFELKRIFTYPTEGWGITHDGERLIMSDGSANLYFWDPQTLEEIGRVQVFDNQGPVVRLNELEYINDEVFANVWQTDWVARIDPDTGQVAGWIDLSGLLTAEDRSQPVDVLNGIAYDSESDRLFVTGKFWPKVFEIELVER
jgi:glutamine cyclotransferase